MSTELEAYRLEVERQREQLFDHLSRLGITTDYESDIPEPDPASPLASLVVATKVVAENLAMVTKERDASLREVQEKLRTIELQTASILELSTPVIQVWDEILVLPLIGTIDTARAQQIMENLLEAVVRARAAMVIIDVTGVPLVDTKVADHLLKTIDATRLLGADAVLTGVSPLNAQTLVRLGVDLGRITTRSSLQAGLKLAFERTRRKVSAA
jgi:rsbT co-antagonist protein RsbR